MPGSDENIYIRNPNNDFSIVQNYVIQLVAEKRITASAFVLYSFYQSLNGYSVIRTGYRYIKDNTGLSMGNISKCNELLEKNGLIKRTLSGMNRSFIIDITPGQLLPRRTIKSHYIEGKSGQTDIIQSQTNTIQSQIDTIPDLPTVPETSTDPDPISDSMAKTSEKSSEKKLKNTVVPAVQKEVLFNTEEKNFIDSFITSWKTHCQSKYYPKKDYYSVKKLKDIADASKYIEVLWCLDDVDDWVRKSDHSISIFVKEYRSGRLQAMYPNTIYHSIAKR